MIFDHLFDLCEPPGPDTSDPLVDEYPTTFPFNVANVCSRWLDISLLRRSYWNNVIIDVSRDPTPFLKAFDLIKRESHQHKIIDVVVFCTDNGQRSSSEKALENFRASKVYSCLEQTAIRYCRSITFELVYQSSLPSAAGILSHELVHLSELCLLCTEHDFDTEEAAQETERRRLTQPPKRNVPVLEKLDLTGFSFMEMCRLGRDFLQNLSNGKLELFITYFSFREEASTPTTQSLTSFVGALDLISSKSDIHTLSLFDITFDHQNSQVVETDFALAVKKLSFDSVSSEFIDKFFYYSLFRFDRVATLTFKRCHVPLMRLYGCHPHLKLKLYLVDIPPLPSNCALSQAHQNVPVQDDSMVNAMVSFDTLDVVLLRCRGVTDPFLRRLTWMGTPRAIAPYLRHLRIHDCTGFTPSGVHSLVSARARMSKEIGQFVCVPLWDVTVSGMGPSLSDEEAAGVCRCS